MKNQIILISLLILSVLFFVNGCSDDSSESENEITKVDTIEVLPNEFGLNVDSLSEFRGRVKKNETLTDILLPHGVSYKDIYNLSLASKGKFNLRKINYGKDYVIYTQEDSIPKVDYFVYLSDPVNYTVFDLRDSMNIYSAAKDVVVRENQVAGVIEFSLYETLSEANTDIQLALKLSEVFAWQIDFFALQKGDLFKVVFEEEYVDDKFFRIGKIKAAYFNHKNSDYYGFYFRQDDKDDYFDEENNSLYKDFLKAPLKFSRISSRYSRSRYHPILKRYRPHLGIDYAAPTGTPIQSVGDGVVVTKKYQKGGAGRYLKIKHNGTYTSGYMHLSRYAKGINVGSKVRQGDIIGYVGSSGLSTGPHLDFRFWKNGSPVNYLNIEFPSSHPVKEENVADFILVKDRYKPILDSMQISAQKNQTLTAK
jgi:murein DD-endopeptidase MepM/ murein hydrolase activator NlpD